MSRKFKILSLSCPHAAAAWRVCISLVVLVIFTEISSGELQDQSLPKHTLQNLNYLQPQYSLGNVSLAAKLSRAKRDKDGPSPVINDYDDDEEDEEKRNDGCIVLPPNPPKVRGRSHPATSLLDLLNSGSQYLAGDENVQDVILILGNTGSGKTTLTQIIAGDLSRLHAVLTMSKSMVIIDDDNRIGAPTTVSKTLVPELVMKTEVSSNSEDGSSETSQTSSTTIAIYDCPGFDDTRGPEKDIAANYFINQITKKASRLKMLFLVQYSSIKIGNDRLDFPLLVKHAVNFLQNVEKYKDSIALVVTKVRNHDDMGYLTSDRSIMKKIVEFLRTYNNTLHDQLLSAEKPVSEDILKQQIQFIKALMQKNEEGRYSRISFSRDPDKCGPLSESPSVSKTRKKVTKLYKRLKYSPLDTKGFGYTLKDETLLALRDNVVTLNNAVESAVSVTMQDFNAWFSRRCLDISSEQAVTVVAEGLRKAIGVMGELHRSLTQLGSLSNPENVLKVMQESLTTLDYSLSKKFQNFMRLQQKYFEFFDEATNSKVTRSIRDWADPVRSLVEKLEEFKDWYEFCEGLEKHVETYDWQRTKPAPPPPEADFLDYLEWECVYPVRQNIKVLSIKMSDEHWSVLRNIVEMALLPTGINCGREDEKIVKVTGNFVKLSEVFDADGFVKHCENNEKINHIEIYAAHTVFIDTDVSNEGDELNLVLIAPKWSVIGLSKQISLIGAPGESRVPPSAANGANQTDNGVGGTGEDGLAGLPGGPGGSFYGISFSRGTNLNKLTIKSVGGKGGKGQDGGTGGVGEKGNDASWGVTSHVHTDDRFILQYEEHRHGGYRGYDGGNGGDGGSPGEGGKPGKITFITSENNPERAKVNTNWGEEGEAGEGGLGGNGGDPGSAVECEKVYRLYGIFGSRREKCFWSHSKAAAGFIGAPGNKGASNTGKIAPKQPTYSIVEWRSILNFKLAAAIEFNQNETRSFIQFLDSEPSLTREFTVEAYVEEARLMEVISMWGNERQLHKSLSSYIRRVEEFTQENFATLTIEEKKVLSYLLTFAYSKLVSLDQNRGIGVVVDVGQYITVVKGVMEKFKDSSALAAVENGRKTFEANLEKKVEETRALMSKAVIPAMHEAEAELHTKLKHLGKQFEGLILDSEMRLDKAKALLQKAVEEKAREDDILIYKQVFGFLTRIIRFIDLCLGGEIALGTEFIPFINEVTGSAQGVFKDFQTFIGSVTEIGSGNGVEALLLTLDSARNLLNSTNELLDLFQNDADELDEDTDIITTARDADNNVPQLDSIISKISLFFGNETASNLALHNSHSALNDERIEKMETLVQQAEIFLNDTIKRKLLIEQSFIPVVQGFLSSLGNVVDRMQNKSESESSTIHRSQLQVGSWQVTRMLREIKGQIDMLSKGIDTRLFVNSIDKLQDALTMIISLFEGIAELKETQHLAQFMSIATSAKFATVHVTDSKLSSALADLEKATTANMFMAEYHKALHAFKMWVFPFAKLYLEKYLDESEFRVEKGNAANLGETVGKKVDRLQLDLQRYKATTLNVQDMHLIHTNFSSGLKSSSPFFVWKNEDWPEAMENLLSGLPVSFKADVRESPYGKDAIKFKLIEANLRVPETKQNSRENQNELNKELGHFGVIMTHSGVSYYRFHNNYYTMTGANQTIRFNFERNRSGGNRLGTNRVYEKFRNGDYLLSPYTLWTIQIVNVSPQRKNNLRDFQRLQRFMGYVDLELVGTGIYVDTTRSVQNLEVDKFYMRDDSIRNDFHF